MSNFVVIRPKDDAAARQASDWCDDLITQLVAKGHTKVRDVTDRSPANRSNILAALGIKADLVCYFGHGDDDCWLTHSTPTVDGAAASAASGKAIVSIACNTGRTMGPNAVSGGVAAWLGFTINVPCVSPHKTRDPFGEAIVDGLKRLANGRTMRQARDGVTDALDALSDEFYMGGTLSGHPSAWLGHFAAIALRDHVTVNGNANVSPL